MLQEIDYYMVVFELSRVIFLALAVSFLILLFDKWGLRNHIIEKTRVKFIADLFSCDFCLSFWVSVLVSSICIIAGGDTSFLIYPFLATPIVRVLI